ncbi:DEAD/DEAH box helicase family protein [Chryseobacterium sp. 22458]|uniref:DEAD/DEAH box helicase family protein n=1 Tax=Chryseobacterium sp. 22458 TaxID=3453921 RepID=UPI003F84966B
MEIKQAISNTIDKLKDFQLKTVEKALESYRQGNHRFLIADEVGLGKTIVAKGIIAKLYLEAFDKNNDFKVIYICSNKALAKQNIAKLVPFAGTADFDSGEVLDFSDEDDRLTSLAFEDIKNANKFRLKIKALTPSTSFDTNSKAGKKDERILIYRILSTTSYFRKRKTALKWFLRATVSSKNWENDISNQRRKIRSDINQEFLTCLQYDVQPIFLQEIQKAYKKINHNIENHTSLNLLEILQCIIPENKRSSNTSSYIPNSQIVNKIIGEIRLRLASACKQYLKADLFILDEFQRFKQIIDSKYDVENPGIQLAKEIFDIPNVKLLLLSATPYKAYATKFEQLHGEDHYQEFKSVLTFLFPNYSKEDWKHLDQLNHKYFEGLKSVEKITKLDSELLTIKNQIEVIYKNAISRTERNLVEKFDRNKENDVKILPVNESDLYDFILIDQIVKELNEKYGAKLNVPTEYVKSAPYPLSFLSEYQHFKVLQQKFNQHGALKKNVVKAKNAFISKDKIIEYKPLIPEKSQLEPNPKLRLLYQDLRNEGYKYLWLPPTLPYYNVNTLPYRPLSKTNNNVFSKTLIFSAWKLVPRMISTLVSYEAERLSVGDFLIKEARHKEESQLRSKTDSKRYPYPLLVYRNNESHSSLMNYSLTYPCISLAKLIDPMKFLQKGLSDQMLIKELKKQIIKELKKLDIQTVGIENGDKNDWKWYSLLFLDKRLHHDESSNWFSNPEKIGVELDHLNDDQSNEKNYIFLQFKENFEKDTIENKLAKLSNDDLDQLAEYLANMSLGSPAICSYRAFYRLFPEEKRLINASHFVANSFRTLFNKPESISIIKQFFRTTGYYNNVLDYCINGNIQAMLDEFFYQLHDSGGLYNSRDIAVFIADILSVSSSSLDVKTFESLSDSNKDLKMRVHYAMPFGMEGKTDNKSANRTIKIREAFNSPFRPFVLTSTSIGQEGLDFHYYCNKIIHWNLPHNPIDLEQREGRIKRYKGFNIRNKMIASLDIQKLQILNNDNIWKIIYTTVEAKKLGKCDLIPYWYYPDKDNVNSIETIIPLYPYSRDLDKLNYIKNVLVNYRLTFGQPRQEELVYMLGENSSNEQYRENLIKFLINLCPTIINDY